MDNLSLGLMCGIDILMPELKMTLHQPTIKEIAYLGEENFFQAVQCLMINKTLINQDKNNLEDISNFQIFMTVIQDQTSEDKKFFIINLLEILFPLYKVSFTPNSVVCVNKDKLFVIDENNFNIVQDYLKEIFCFNKQSGQEESFNPANEKAKAIADKLMQGRQRVAAEKRDSSNSNSMFSQYLSSLAVAINSMSLNDLMNLTMYQIYDLVERYSLYMNWDINIRSRLAGADIKDKPDNWMKNIH